MNILKNLLRNIEPEITVTKIIALKILYLYLFKKLGDFPGGTVVKNPPANAGDMGSSPGLGRSHMPWSN